jgi:Protein of unknown function (DUF2795)
MTDSSTSPGGPGSKAASDPGATKPDEQSHEEVLARSEMARFLRPSVLPAGKAAIVEAAREDDAPGYVIAQLDRLPEDVEFPNVAAIREALGHETEHRQASTPSER